MPESDFLRRCVSCGQPRSENHKCDQKHEAARKAAQTKANNEETFLGLRMP